MKGFSFFVGVFSAGLVIFLFFTGQFSALFTGPDGSVGGAEWTEPFDSEDVNRVNHTSIDPDAGRVQFTLSGDLDQEAIRIDEIDTANTLSNAVITIPIYRGDGATASASEPDASGLSSMTELVLKTARISYQPEDLNKKIQLRGGIEGTGNDGSQFRTETMDLTFGENESAELVGTEAVTATFPAFQLFGTNGFTGAIDASVGLTHLTIQPPVVVALDRTRGGSLLGLGETEADGAADGEQVFLIGHGPLVIDRKKNQAIFQDDVVVFRASNAATLNPAPDPKRAPSRFECEGLRLDFDPKTLRFVDAEALRGTHPVRAYLTDPDGEVYKLTTNRLSWGESLAQVDLEGDIQIDGEIGRFGALEATLFPAERRCELRRQVFAHLRSDKLNEKQSKPGDEGSTNSSGETNTKRDGKTGATLESDWILAADRADFVYSSKREAGASGVERFRAYSDTPGKLKIREDRQGGARLEGTELVYEAKTGAVKVSGSEAAPNVRPVFLDGRNRVNANVIRLRLDARELTFEDGVTSEIHNLALRTGNKPPKWLRNRGPDNYADIRCEWLRVGWGENSEVVEIEARGYWSPSPGSPIPADAKQLSFRVWGEEACVVTADHFTWSRTEQTLTLKGRPGKQRLESEFSILVGQEIAFDLAKLELAAVDPEHVALDVRRAKLVNSKSSSTAPNDKDDSMVRIKSPFLTLSLAETSDPSDPKKAAGKAEESDEGSRSLTLVGARAWTEREGDSVTINDGVLAASGREVRWDATKGSVELDGDGRQRIFHFGLDGVDELTAEKIFIDTNEQRAELEGNVVAVLHQGPPPRAKENSRRASKASQTEALRQSLGDFPWRVEAGHLELWFQEQVVVSREGAAPKTRLAPDRMKAIRGVKISHPGSLVRFNGTSCEWQRQDQTLRIFDPDGQGVQTLQHGEAQTDSIIARQIHITPELETGQVRRIWVYLQDDVIGTFRPAETNRSRKTPESMRLIADNLLVEMVPEQKQTVQSAAAWGDVTFQGGDYKVLADRAIYREQNQSVSFTSAAGEQVQLIHRRKPKNYDRLNLQRNRRGGYTIDLKGGESWRGGEIKKLLERIQKEERNPKR